MTMSGRSIIPVVLFLSALLLAGCGGGSRVPAPTINAQSTPAPPGDNPLAYIRIIDPATSNEYFETNRQLFDYDQELALDIQEVSTRIEEGLSVIDITYASPKGGRAPATLIIPRGRGPFAGIVMQRSMELEFAMHYARYGAVVIFVDAPSFRPQPGPPRGILTFTEQDVDEQIQLIIDLRRAIDLLLARPDVDPQRIGYLGVSYGGAMGGLLAGVENRLKAYVLIVGDGGLVTHVTNPENRTGQLDSFYEEYGVWIEAMWPIEPIHFVSHASPAPLLFQNALQDHYTNVDDALRYHDVASEPKDVFWYDSEHWPLPEEVVMDNARWLQQFIGPGALLLLPTPNFRHSAIIIDRLLLAWIALTAASLAFAAWHLRSRVGKPLRSNGWWFVLIAVMGVIGLAGYMIWAKRLHRKPKSV